MLLHVCIWAPACGHSPAAASPQAGAGASAEVGLIPPSYSSGVAEISSAHEEPQNSSKPYNRLKPSSREPSMLHRRTSLCCQEEEHFQSCRFLQDLGSLLRAERTRGS